MLFTHTFQGAPTEILADVTVSLALSSLVQSHFLYIGLTFSHRTSRSSSLGSRLSVESSSELWMQSHVISSRPTLTSYKYIHANLRIGATL